MNWARFIKRFFIVLVLSIVGSTVLLGGFGFLLAGKEGMINAGSWGLILGIMGGLSGGVLFALNAKFWGDYAGRFGSAYVKKLTEGDKDQPHEQEDYSKWKV